MSNFEEQLRAKLCEKFELNGFIKKKDTAKKISNKLVAKESFEKSNLYFNINLSLGLLIDIVQRKKIYENSHLSNIRNLRNKVMHHNLLMIGKSTDKKSVLIEISSLEKELESLYHMLHADYQDGFENDINKCNNIYAEKETTPFSSRIRLKKMINGEFTR